MIAADTSFILSLYLSDTHGEAARALLSNYDKPLLLSPLAKVEFINGLEQQVFRKTLNEAQVQLLRQGFAEDLHAGRWIIGENFSTEVWEKGENLSLNYSSSLGVRSLDLLHIAYTLILGAEKFWSFDHKQRSLAAEVGLKLNTLN